MWGGHLLMSSLDILSWWTRVSLHCVQTGRRLWVIHPVLEFGWLSWLKSGFVVPSVCVCWYVTFLYSLCFWFYIIYNSAANLCVCVLDMPNILQHLTKCQPLKSCFLVTESILLLELWYLCLSKLSDPINRVSVTLFQEVLTLTSWYSVTNFFILSLSIFKTSLRVWY